jgi:hypothetical protein
LQLRDRRANRQGVADQVRTLIRCAHELTDGVDRAAFNQRPPDGGWSVAECLDHINATARLYLPLFAEAIEDGRARGWTQRGTDGRTWLGRLVAWSQEPPVRFRSRTFAELEPATDLDPTDVYEEFEALHEELIVRINESGSLDQRRIRIRSALNRRLRLSLADWYAFLAAHARRHMWQAGSEMSVKDAVKGYAPTGKDTGIVKSKGTARIPIEDGSPIGIKERKPEWLKVRSPGGENYRRLKKTMRGQRLHTVCEEAGCPNIGECWEAGTATFLILGDVCTRACKYCAIAHGMPTELDEDEPRRVAESVVAMALNHVVDDQREPGRAGRRRRRDLRGDDPAHSRGATRVHHRGADARLQGGRGGHRHCLPREARHLRPQPGDGGAAAPVGTAGRPVLAEHLVPGLREEARPRHAHQVRHHGRAGRDAGRDPAGARGSAEGRRRHRHHRPVPPPVGAPRPRRPVGHAAGVPGVEADRRGGARVPPRGVRRAGPLQLPRRDAGPDRGRRRRRRDHRGPGQGRARPGELSDEEIQARKEKLSIQSSLEHGLGLGRANGDASGGANSAATPDLVQIDGLRRTNG